VRAARQRYCYKNKSFLVLFFKKELLAFFLLANLGYGSTIKAAGINASCHAARSKQSFVEKKAQKTPIHQLRDSRVKVFCCFFSKKQAFLSYTNPRKE
jgi:hypothetical protein